MRTRILLLSLTILFVLVNGLLYVRLAEQFSETGKPAPLPPPKLVVEETVYRFGERDPGAVVSHVFVLRNEGSGPLWFKGVRSVDQGSVSGHVVPHVVPPQGVARLHAKAHVGPRNGSVRREILIETNDPDHPTVTFLLEGNAVSRVRLTPERLNLRGVSSGQPREATLELRTTGGLALHVVGSRTSSEAIAVHVKEIIPGSQYNVRVTIRPLLKQGPFRGWVHLLTDHHSYKVIGIPVALHVGGRNGNVSVPGAQSSQLGEAKTPEFLRTTMHAFEESMR